MHPKDIEAHLDQLRALGVYIPQSASIADLMDQQKRDSAKAAYSIYRGGFREGMKIPPHWDDLQPFMRDALTVVYLQGKLDRP